MLCMRANSIIGRAGRAECATIVKRIVDNGANDTRVHFQRRLHEKETHNGRICFRHRSSDQRGNLGLP